MRAWVAVLVGAATLAACDRASDDPLARNRVTCANANAEAAERDAACTALIDGGELGEAERAEAQAHRGVARRASGQVTPALRDFEAALRVDENNAEALAGRAAILLASGQLDAVEPLVDRLIAQGDELDQAHLMKGDIAFQRGDYQAAITSYDEAINRNRGLALAYAHRGRAKQRLQDDVGALADFDAAVRNDNDLVDARAARCWLSVQQSRNLDRARGDAETAVAAAPENVEAQLCRGVLQLRGGEWAGARTSFEAALAIEPGNPTALFGRGVARRRSGDNDGRDDMDRARDFDRHIGEAFDDMGVRTF
jgi:tetratricopeptide (TPR) repeat protein